MTGYLASLWQFRYFIFALVRLDLRARYRGTALGLGWTLVHPLAMTGILCLVFHRVFQAEITDYAPFVLAGLACWHYLVGSIVQGCQSFIIAEPYIRQQPTPLAIYPLRTVIGTSIHFLIVLVLVLAVTWSLRGFGNLASLWCLLPGLAVLFILGLALATLSGIGNVYFRDTRHACDVGLPLLFYLTPVAYQSRLLGNSSLAWLVDANPLGSVLHLVRDPIVAGTLPPTANIWMAVLTTLVAAAAAVVCLARVQRRLVFAL